MIESRISKTLFSNREKSKLTAKNNTDRPNQMLVMKSKKRFKLENKYLANPLSYSNPIVLGKVIDV